MTTGKLIIAGVFASAMFMACGNAETKSNEEATKSESHADHASHDGVHQINVEESDVMWKGTMMGMYSHQGTVPLVSAYLETKGKDFVGGEFVIDLTNINPTDDGYSEEKPKEKLVGHLSSPDFFDVENHPTAKFVVTGSKDSLLMGNLTVRGITNEETAVITKHDMDAHTLDANLTFDRTKYDVNFKHPMQEMVLSNDIEIMVHLQAEMPKEETAAAH